VDTNQDELAKALANLDLRAPYIVLDGHFCVLDTVGGISAIPLATYIGLKLKLVVILTDSPEQIRDRLLSRDGRAQSCEEIRRLQTWEIAHGNAVAEAMKIPIRLFNKSEVEAAVSYILSEIQPKELP